MANNKNCDFINNNKRVLLSYKNKEQVTENNISNGRNNYISFRNKSGRSRKSTAGANSSEDILGFVEKGEVENVRNIITERPEILQMKDQLQGASLLHFAAHHNQLNIINLLIELGADIQLTDDDGNTALHWCAQHNSIEAMMVLLDLGADISILNHQRNSTLHIAVHNNRVELFKTLLNSNRDIDIVIHGPRGKTPIHVAAELDALEITTEMLAYGKRVYGCSAPNKECNLETASKFRLCARDADGNTPSHSAARAGSAKVLKFFLTNCINAGYQKEILLKFITQENASPLHNAIDGGHAGVVEVLLECGADPWIISGDLLPPFHITACMKDLSCLKSMIKFIPVEAINTKDQAGNTGLYKATSVSGIEAVKLLLEANADPNILCNNAEESALHLSVKMGSSILFNLIIENGGDYCSLNGNGDTILHLALERPNADIIKICIEHKERDKVLNIKNRQDKSALELAVCNDKRDAIMLLCDAQSKLHANNNLTSCKCNLLHIAAKSGHYFLSKFILNYYYGQGKNILNETIDGGGTPLHKAAMHGHANIVELLLNNGATIHQCDEGYTPVSGAAAFGYLKVLKILLNAFSYARDLPTRNGNTPLHLAALAGHTDIVLYLLDKNADITLNYDGQTFLYEAIRNNRKSTVMCVIKHARWQQVLDTLSPYSPPPFVTLVMHMPIVAQQVMNQCVEHSSFGSKRSDYWVLFNMKYLRLPENIPAVTKSESMNSVYKLDGNSDSISMSVSTNSSFFQQNKIFDYNKVHALYALDTMVKFGRTENLTHPLIHKFLDLKWHSYGFFIYLMGFALFFAYIILISIFAAVYPPDYTCSEQFPTWTSLNASNPSFISQSGFLVFRSIIDLMALAYLLLFLAFAAAARDKISYMISFPFLVELFCYISTLMYLPLHRPCPYWGSGAVSLFLGWLTLFFYVGQFASMSVYTRMFVAVLRTVVNLSVLALILLLAHAYAFFILLSTLLVEYRFVERSLFETFLMLIGEPNFTPITEFTYNSMNQPLPNKGLTYVFLVLGGFLMTIIFSNLLIGLAVGDIDRVKASAYQQKIIDRISLFGNIDRFLPLWIKRETPSNKKVIVYPNKFRFGKFSLILHKVIELISPPGIALSQESFSNVPKDERIAKLEKSVMELKDVINKQNDMFSVILEKFKEPRKNSLPKIDSVDSDYETNRMERSSSTLSELDL